VWFGHSFHFRLKLAGLCVLIRPRCLLLTHLPVVFQRLWPAGSTFRSATPVAFFIVFVGFPVRLVALILISIGQACAPAGPIYWPLAGQSEMRNRISTWFDGQGVSGFICAERRAARWAWPTIQTPTNKYPSEPAAGIGAWDYQDQREQDPRRRAILLARSATPLRPMAVGQGIRGRSSS